MRENFAVQLLISCGLILIVYVSLHHSFMYIPAHYLPKIFNAKYNF
jgi:hypothetical protein